MHFNIKCLVLVFVCVSGYKIASVPNGSSNEDHYSVLISNQSNDITANDFEPEHMEYQRKSSTIDGATAAAAAAAAAAADVRSEALIKKIHPFVYPKQFNTLERLPPQLEFNATNGNLIEIRNMEAINQQNSDRIDESFAPDHKHSNSDILPLSTHLPKHGNFHYGYYDRPYYHHPAPSHGHNCLLGLLHGNDLSLLLLGILGFVAYVINALLGLVDRLNLPLLAPVMAATGMATSAVTAATPVTKMLVAQRHNFDDRTVDSHQRLLKDFERILQMAIEVYEQKMNNEKF